MLSATIANGELFRVYPGAVPGRSIAVHQNSTPLDLSKESVAEANLESGLREHLVFGRNEPGLQHRHETWTNAVSAVGR